MTTRPNPPVICANCSSFALADLEGVPLCAGCLMSALLSSPDPGVFEHIVPLDAAGLPHAPSPSPEAAADA